MHEAPLTSLTSLTRALGHSRLQPCALPAAPTSGPLHALPLTWTAFPPLLRPCTPASKPRSGLSTLFKIPYHPETHHSPTPDPTGGFSKILTLT